MGLNNIHFKFRNLDLNQFLNIPLSIGDSIFACLSSVITAFFIDLFNNFGITSGQNAFSSSLNPLSQTSSLNTISHFLNVLKYNAHGLFLSL